MTIIAGGPYTWGSLGSNVYAYLDVKDEPEAGSVSEWESFCAAQGGGSKADAAQYPDSGVSYGGSSTGTTSYQSASDFYTNEEEQELLKHLNQLD